MDKRKIGWIKGRQEGYQKDRKDKKKIGWIDKQIKT